MTMTPTESLTEPPLLPQRNLSPTGLSLWRIALVIGLAIAPGVLVSGSAWTFGYYRHFSWLLFLVPFMFAVPPLCGFVVSSVLRTATLPVIMRRLLVAGVVVLGFVGQYILSPKGIAGRYSAGLSYAVKHHLPITEMRRWSQELYAKMKESGDRDLVIQPKDLPPFLRDNWLRPRHEVRVAAGLSQRDDTYLRITWDTICLLFWKSPIPPDYYGDRLALANDITVSLLP